MTTTNQHQQKTTKRGKYAKAKTNVSSYANVISASNTTNRSSSTNATRTSRRTTKKKKSIDIKATIKNLYNKISKNDVKWYWDLKKWIPMLFIAMVIMYAIGYSDGEEHQIAVFENIPAETVYVEIIKEVEPSEEDIVLDEEAVALAILADTSAVGKSDNVKRILMWVAINRVEDKSNGYGGTLLEEINRPKQWQGYNSEGMYLQTTYDIALEVLDTWRNNGPRPIYNDMLWSVFNRDGSITVRNRFTDSNNRQEQTFS